jgi:hypothetical protein
MASDEEDAIMALNGEGDADEIRLNKRHLDDAAEYEGEEEVRWRNGFKKYTINIKWLTSNSISLLLLLYFSRIVMIPACLMRRITMSKLAKMMMMMTLKR